MDLSIAHRLAVVAGLQGLWEERFIKISLGADQLFHSPCNSLWIVWEPVDN